MATTTPRPAVCLSRQALRHYRSRDGSTVTRPLIPTCSRTFTSSTPRSSEAKIASADPPRWSYTPMRMKAPFSPHIQKNPNPRPWQVNEDPQKLDQALVAFLGRDGDKLLPEELKWLAVTHKSFDQGRRGFNDRLAFFGRQLCLLEATESIIISPKKYDTIPADPFAEEREPFEDPSLRSVDNLSITQPSELFTLDQLAKLAVATGLSKVVRWKPRMHENLAGSGLPAVMASAVYALVGAIALQNGAKTAGRIVRERIIRKVRL